MSEASDVQKVPGTFARVFHAPSNTYKAPCFNNDDESEVEIDYLGGTVVQQKKPNPKSIAKTFQLVPVARFVVGQKPHHRCG